MRPKMNPEAAVQAWNRCNRVGDHVEVTLDDGTTKQTETRSQAWVMGGHSAMVMLEGVSGAYALHRVRPVNPVS
jgi:hypothetical protein